MRYIFLGILSSFLFTVAVHADTSFQRTKASVARIGIESSYLALDEITAEKMRDSSSPLPELAPKTSSPVQRIFRIGWDPLANGFSKLHLTTLDLSQTGYYLYRTLTLPIALASSSYHHICQHISCFESTERTRLAGNAPGAGARQKNARAINAGATQQGKIHLAYAATNALDISLRVENFPIEGLPEAHPSAQISQKPLGRTIGLQFEFRF